MHAGATHPRPRTAARDIPIEVGIYIPTLVLGSRGHPLRLEVASPSVARRAGDERIKKIQVKLGRQAELTRKQRIAARRRVVRAMEMK